MSMKAVVISGGMGDIGRAIAIQFAKSGRPVALLYHNTEDTEVTSFLKTLPDGDHTAFRCDLTDGSSLEQAINSITERFGGISVCVHAAVGAIVRKSASAIAPEEFKQQFDVTCFGALRLFQAVIPHMESGDAIVGITTTAAEQGGQGPAMAGYVAAKYALRAVLRELARELAPRGILVAAVAPGFVATNLHRDLPEQVFNFLKDRQPAALVSTPEEVAAVVVRVCGMKISESGKSFTVKEGASTPL